MLYYSRQAKQFGRDLRKNQTQAEQVLWARIRRKQILNVQFYRQKPIDRYIVDFYCAAARLVIELDGSQHYTPDAMAYDAKRTELLESLGLKVIRFANHRVFFDVESVLAVIHAEVRERMPNGRMETQHDQ